MPKTYDIEAKHIFTDEEKLAHHEQRSNNALEIEEAEQQIKALKSKVQRLEAENSRFDRYGKYGFTFELYSCRAAWNSPKPGRVKFIRLSDGECLEERDMTDVEMRETSQIQM